MNSYTRYWPSLSYIMPNLVENLFVTALDFYFYVNTPASHLSGNMFAGNSSDPCLNCYVCSYVAVSSLAVERN